MREMGVVKVEGRVGPRDGSVYDVKWLSGQLVVYWWFTEASIKPSRFPRASRTKILLITGRRRCLHDHDMI